MEGLCNPGRGDKSLRRRGREEKKNLAVYLGVRNRSWRIKQRGWSSVKKGYFVNEAAVVANQHGRWEQQLGVGQRAGFAKHRLDSQLRS